MASGGLWLGNRITHAERAWAWKVYLEGLGGYEEMREKGVGKKREKTGREREERGRKLPL